MFDPYDADDAAAAIALAEARALAGYEDRRPTRYDSDDYYY